MTRRVSLPDAPIADDAGRLSIAWLQRFTLWQAVVDAAKQSGPTADRPTAGLWVGRRYFDTTLGQPVWVQSLTPTVWCDATGAAV